MTAPLRTHRPGDIVRIRAQRWRVARHVAYGTTTVLEVVGQDEAVRGRPALFLLPFEPIECLPASRSPLAVRPARWRRRARHTLGHALPSMEALRTTASADLSVLPFQLEPALAITRGLGCRVLLADEVGLGKTVQAGIIVTELLGRHPDAQALVVAPAGLCDQWRHELNVRFNLPSLVLDAAALACAGTAAPAGANPWTGVAVVITSIDFIKRPEVLRSLEGLIWDATVFDEAHALAGASDRASAAAALAARARTVVLLSATPHAGDDAAFARLCGLGDPQRRFPLLLFRRTRDDAGIASARRTTWLRIRPTPAELRMHRALDAYARLVWRQAGASGRNARLAMSVLARRACSSPASLARSIERRLSLLDGPFPPASAQLALPLSEPGADDAAPLALLMAPGLGNRADERRRLEHILLLARTAARAESKLRAIVRLLRRSAEPAIVFTEYRDTLAQVARAVPDVTAVVLHGGLTRSERAAAVHQFTTGKARLLLATDAASEGLNLHQRCRLVVNLELPWTPRRLEQRIGRVDRIGQRSTVHAVQLMAADTSEDTIVRRLLGRMARVRTVLGDLRAAAATEEQMARAVLGAEPLEPPSPDSSTVPAGILVPDLRAAARAEAARLLLARRLQHCGWSPSRAGHRPARAAESSGRPVLTLLRRHGGRQRCYWVFRVEVEDADGWTLWSPIVALTGEGHARPARRPAAIRALLNPDQPVLVRASAREHHHVLAAARASLRLPLALAIGREQALLAGIHETHARLSAALLQPGLFDRRTERRAAAQTAILDEAVARARTRLDRLARAGAPAAGSCELVFALVR